MREKWMVMDIFKQVQEAMRESSLVSHSLSHIGVDYTYVATRNVTPQKIRNEFTPSSLTTVAISAAVKINLGNRSLG